jgi:hypothetical protein
MKMALRLITASFLIGSIILIGACQPNDNGTPIPYVPVNVTVDLNSPDYLALNPYGGYVILPNHGNKGIIIYHQFDDTYVCYDMTCSYEPTNPCNQIEVDENGFLLQCGNTVNGEFEPCCGSKFLWDGFPTAGPALFSLTQYVVYRNGNLLRVSN